MVGGSLAGDGFSGFIWSAQDGIADLNDLLADQGGIRIVGAWDINDRGDILASSTDGIVLLKRQ